MVPCVLSCVKKAGDSFGAFRVSMLGFLVSMLTNLSLMASALSHAVCYRGYNSAISSCADADLSALLEHVGRVLERAISRRCPVMPLIRPELAPCSEVGEWRLALQLLEQLPGRWS